MKENKYLNMSNDALSKILYEYAKERDGEIADITYAASVKLAVLEAKTKQMEDDGK